MATATPPHPGLLVVLLGWTAITGVVDAVSFLALGHVFTANMTGNVVFMAFAVAGAPGLSIPRSATALIAFFIGAMIGGRIAVRMSVRPQHHWTTATLCIEATLLFAAMAVSIGLQGTDSTYSMRLYGIIILTAFAMGLRNATVRKLAVPDLTTTVLTLTITGLAADSSLAGGGNLRWQRRTASVVLMFAGAALGTLLLRHSVALALAVCSLFSGCSSVAILVRNRGNVSPNN